MFVQPTYRKSIVQIGVFPRRRTHQASDAHDTPTGERMFPLGDEVHLLLQLLDVWWTKGGRGTPRVGGE